MRLRNSLALFLLNHAATKFVEALSVRKLPAYPPAAMSNQSQTTIPGAVNSNSPMMARITTNSLAKNGIQRLDSITRGSVLLQRPGTVHHSGLGSEGSGSAVRGFCGSAVPKPVHIC